MLGFGPLSAAPVSALPGGPPFTLVQTLAFSQAASNTTITNSLASTAAPGDLVVVFAFTELYPATTGTVTDTWGDGGTWSSGAAATQYDTNSNAEQVWVFWKQVGATTPSGKAITLTCLSSGTNVGFAAQVFRPGTPGTVVSLDGTEAGATGLSTAPSPGSITTTVPGLVVGVSSSSAALTVAGVGFTAGPANVTAIYYATQYDITGASGAYTPSYTTGASGNWASIVVGFKAVVVVGITPTGVIGTGVVGTPSASTATTPTHVIGTGVVGTPAASTSATPASVVGTGAVGTPVANFSTALAGVAGTGVVGAVTAVIGSAVTVALTQVSGTGVVGTPAASTSATPASVVGTGAVGTPAASTSTTPASVVGTGVVGTLTAVIGGAVNVTLTGVAGTGVVGAVGANLSTALTGVAGAGVVGAVGIGAALTGVAGTGVVGAVGPGTTIALTGVAGTGVVGSLGAGTTGSISQVAGTGVVSSVGTETDAALTQVAGTGVVGTITANVLGPITVALTGVSGTGVVGNMQANNGYVNPMVFGGATKAQHDKWKAKGTPKKGSPGYTPANAVSPDPAAEMAAVFKRLGVVAPVQTATPEPAATPVSAVADASNDDQEVFERFAQMVAEGAFDG